VRRARRRQKETPLKEVRSEALLLTKRKSSPMILWDYPFLIDSNQDGDVKPESLVSNRPSLYSIGGVVSMHPTVLYCSPMKERDEGRKRIQGKESLESTATRKAVFCVHSTRRARDSAFRFDLVFFRLVSPGGAVGEYSREGSARPRCRVVPK
jgi:hypothetical protein